VGVRRYQDLDAWRLANDLKREIYALIDSTPAGGDRRFCDQLRASAGSAPANLAEGFGCFVHTEFARYVRIARASLFEAHNHLGDGADRHYWSSEESTRLQELADRAIRATTRLLRYLTSTPTPGSSHPKKRGSRTQH
jgi:four helix bundle protein